MAQTELKSAMKKLHGSRFSDAKSSGVTIASPPRCTDFRRDRAARQAQGDPVLTEKFTV
jgi:hypothetical protein